MYSQGLGWWYGTYRSSLDPQAGWKKQKTRVFNLKSETTNRCWGPYLFAQTGTREQQFWGFLEADQASHSYQTGQVVVLIHDNQIGDCKINMFSAKPRSHLLCPSSNPRNQTHALEVVPARQYHGSEILAHQT